MSRLAKRFKNEFYKIISKIKMQQLYSIAIFSLMFLYGFFPGEYARIVLVLIIGLVGVKILVCREVLINSTVILIALFGFSYFIFDAINYGLEIDNFVKYAIAPAAMYEVGINVLRTYKNKQKAFLDMIFALSLGFATYVLLGFFVRILQFGLFSDSRVVVDIWTNQYTAATGAGVLISLIGSMVFPVLFVKSPEKKWYHITGVLVFTVVSILVALSLSNRAQLIILVCGLIIGALFLVLIDKKRRKALFYVILIVGFIVIVPIILYHTKLFGFDELILKIPLIKRIFLESGLLESERFGIYVAFFKQFLYYPFGGQQIYLPNNSYCHNVWLDIYYFVGVVPCVLFIIITFVAIKRAIVVSILEKRAFTNILILCCFFTLLMVFMIEPVIQASMYVFLIFFVLLGVIDYFYHQRISEHYLKYSKDMLNGEKVVVAFVSNYLSHHQYAFCRELIKTYGKNFRFISTTTFNDKRIGLEKPTENFDDYVFDLRDEKQKKKAQAFIQKANVIIAGNAPLKLIVSQLKEGKIVLKYSERLYKSNNLFAYLKPKTIYRQLIESYCLRNYKYYYLCASAYTSFDISRFMLSEKRCYKWGYFINESPFSDFDELLEVKNKSETTEILFVNRLIEPKHPQRCISLAKYLKGKSISFKLRIVGAGHLEQQLKDDILSNNLEDCVELLGVLPNEEVLQLMRQSNIVLGNSDFSEGWGVCVNEAMTAGCATVASHSHGSVPYLINHNVNGIIYDFDEVIDMFREVEGLCLNREKTELLGKNAFNTMKTTWSAKTATAKLANFIEGLVSNQPTQVSDGQEPMSSANIYEHDWFKKKHPKASKPCSEPVDLQISGKEQIKKGAIVSYVSVILNIVSALLYTPWMIKIIGDADYSIYTLAMSIIGIFAMDIGLGAALAKYLAKYRAENDKEKANQFLGLIYKVFLVINAVILVVLLLVFVFIDPLYGNTYKDPEMMHKFKVVLAIVSAYTIVSFAGRPLTSILNAHEKFAFQKFVDLIHRIVIITIVVCALLLGGDVYAVVLANVVSGFGAICAKYIYVKTKIKIKPDFGYKDNALLKEVFKFSIWVTISALAARLIMNVTPTVISKMTSDTIQVNIWGIAAIIEGYVFTLSAVVDGMFLPRFSQMRRKNLTAKEYTNVLIKIGRIKLLITGLLVVGFISLGQGFMGIWIESKYGDAYIVAAILLIPTLFTHILMPADTLLIVHDKIKYSALCTIVAGLTCLTGSIILSKYYGAIGSAIGIAIGTFIGFVFAKCYVYRKQLGIDIIRFFKRTLFSFGPQIVACLVFGLALEKLVPTMGWMLFAIKGAILVAFYCAVMWFIGINKEEKDLVESIANPILNQIRRVNESE